MKITIQSFFLFSLMMLSSCLKKEELDTTVFLSFNLDGTSYHFDENDMDIRGLITPTISLTGVNATQNRTNYYAIFEFVFDGGASIPAGVLVNLEGSRIPFKIRGNKVARFGFGEFTDQGFVWRRLYEDSELDFAQITKVVDTERKTIDNERLFLIEGNFSCRVQRQGNPSLGIEYPVLKVWNGRFRLMVKEVLE